MPGEEHSCAARLRRPSNGPSIRIRSAVGGQAFGRGGDDAACGPIFGLAFPLRNPDYSGTVEDATVRSRFWMHHVPVGANTTILASNVQRFDGCGADFTGDGLVSGADAIAFGELYVQGNPEADFEPDGIIDALDVIGYQEAGIP